MNYSIKEQWALRQAVLVAFAANFGIRAEANDHIISGYRARQEELINSSQAILADAETDKRELNAEEKRTIEANTGEVERLEGEIELRNRLKAQSARLTAPQPRLTPANSSDPVVSGQAASSSSTNVQTTHLSRPTANGTGGFRSLGDFAQIVARASHRGGAESDVRLRNASAATVASEGVGSDGGFAVPTDFRAGIMGKVFGEDSLISRTDQQQSGSNQVTFTSDMTTPWDSTNGVQAYWEGEQSSIGQSRPKLEAITMRLHKLAALVPVTEELMEDAPALEGFLKRKVAEKFDFVISNAIVRGTGAGQPLGFMNSGCLVTQAAEGAQTADTIVAGNIAKMYARMPARNRQSAVWLIHPDAEPQLQLMTISNMPVYTPPGGMSGAPYGTLLGRPVIPHQVCETVGDLGDLMFVDLASYMTVTKTGGLRSDVSMHLWFDQQIMAFRFTLRVAGQPWWSTTTAQRDGSNAQSPFITLAAR